MHLLVGTPLLERDIVYPEMSKTFWQSMDYQILQEHLFQLVHVQPKVKRDEYDIRI